MQNKVFVLDKHKKPLMPCHPARARKLLKNKKAAVYRRFPFTIILKHREGGSFQPIRLKYDPGAKVTGIAMVATLKRAKRCIFAAELTHRGSQVKEALRKRRAVRRSRRYRKTRYRKPRFANRTRPKGWLPPSLQSRVDNLCCWTNRFSKLVPITALSVELVRFDTQALQDPEIKGVEYQQGELFGYEVKEYLLEKWGRECIYCKNKEVPLQVEHMIPKARGGTDRVSNLTLACQKCNQKKGALTASEFGHPQLQEKAKKPLRDAAAVNSTRKAIYKMLKQTGLEVECGTGGRTKYNRSQQGYRKEHWLDALCVGQSGEQVFVEKQHQVLELKAMGRGSRQMCRVNQFGFPRTKAKKAKRVRGFQTGDMVKATVPKGKKKGQYQGRVAVRARGYFNIKTKEQTITDISWKNCELLQRQDGYLYTTRLGVSPRP